MQKQISLEQYRRIDLFLFALILLVTEYLIVTAGRKWYPDQLYTVSVTAAVTAIVYMRWGVRGGILAFLGGIVFCFFSGGTLRQFLIYGAGNLFSLPAALAMRKAGPERVREDQLLSLVFAAAVLLSMQAGRAVIAVLTGVSPSQAVGFFTTDSLSLVFTLVIIWVVRRLDGIFEDQKHYLLRIQEEEREQIS